MPSAKIGTLGILPTTVAKLSDLLTDDPAKVGIKSPIDRSISDRNPAPVTDSQLALVAADHMADQLCPAAVRIRCTVGLYRR